MSTDNPSQASMADEPLTSMTHPENSKPKRRGRRKNLLSPNTLLSILQSNLVRLDDVGIHYRIDVDKDRTVLYFPGVILCLNKRHLISTEPCEECQRNER